MQYWGSNLEIEPSASHILGNFSTTELSALKHYLVTRRKQLKPDVVVHACNPTIWEAQEDLEFETSLVYIGSSIPTYATMQDPASKTKGMGWQCS
jgi:hypothetical protein